jgi:lipoprotein NlpI
VVVPQAVELRRRQAAERPTALNPDLGSVFNNLSKYLFELGHQEEELEAIQQAVELRRQLAAFNADLAWVSVTFPFVSQN